MKKVTQKIKCISIVGVALAISAEIAARTVWGLGQPVLYESSQAYGYRPLPNQDILRFGNRIFYNAEGLRSEPISTNPRPGTIRVLCVGDSITYGGVQTDQLETYPYQLQNLLNHQGSEVFEVLNVSAGGWAIENEEAYLRQHGIYGSQIVILQLGSHDLFQPKASSELVGQSASYPSKKPLLALEEGLFRYVLPKFFKNLRFVEPNVQTKLSKQNLNRNIASFVRIANFVKDREAQLVLILVEQPNEMEPKSGLANYSKELLARKAKELNIPYKNLQEDFRKAGNQKLFRDSIHPNPKGNKVMAEVVKNMIQNIVNKSKIV
jgi:lysophospholipase L1-like esterase